MEDYNKEVRFNFIIFAALFGVAFYFYLNYFFVRYEWNGPVEKPTASYETQYPTCDQACDVIKAQRCKEWVSITRPSLCQYTCDAYFNQDRFSNQHSWKDAFSCAEQAHSPYQLQLCKLNCTVINSL